MTEPAVKYRLIKLKTYRRSSWRTLLHHMVLSQHRCLCRLGTLATVKSMSPEELDEMGANIIWNTYHLWFTSGADIVDEAGKLHNFMNWKKGF